MSHQSVTWAYYEAPMLLTEKGKPDTVARQVLGVLGEHATAQGRNAHPSVLRIRYATGLDERTIERALLRLQRAGQISLSGRTREGTRIWNLAMKTVRSASEWADMTAAAEARRCLETERRAARRNRSSSAESDGDSNDVRDAESRMSGTQNPGVRDAESRMSGTERPPNRPSEPSINRPGGTVPGGAPPPDPRRPSAPTASGHSMESGSSPNPVPSQPRTEPRYPLTRTSARVAAGPPLAPVVDFFTREAI